jgi:NAD(P)H-dependent FMN reductase
MRILAVSGSLQAESSNTALLRVARERATAVDLVLFERLADIPPFYPTASPIPQS